MTSLLITDIFPPKTGGTGRWFWEIYRRLPQDEFVIAAGEDPRQEEFDRAHDLRLIRIPLSFPSWGTFRPADALRYGKVLLTVRRLVGELGIDRLHCGRLVPEGWIALLLKRWLGLPYLCYVHGEELSYPSREIAWMTRRVTRGATFLIANSRNTRNILQKVWDVPAAQVRVLNPGVDTERFVPTVRNKAIRANLGWHDRPVVLTVGRLQKRKGQDRLIQALGAIRRKVPNVLYSIVGEGDQRHCLEELVRQNGLQRQVEFRGEIDDREMIKCYQQCDLFALPNREVNGDIEGFGMVLLEAQACGRPVVAGASGGTAETMRTPDTGRIVSCDGSDKLAAVVVELLNDVAVRTQMGKAARQWTVDRFSWESLSRKAYELFSEGFPKTNHRQPDQNAEKPAEDESSRSRGRVEA